MNESLSTYLYFVQNSDQRTVLPGPMARWHVVQQPALGLRLIFCPPRTLEHVAIHGMDQKAYESQHLNLTGWEAVRPDLPH